MIKRPKPIHPIEKKIVPKKTRTEKKHFNKFKEYLSEDGVIPDCVVCDFLKAVKNIVSRKKK